MRNGLLSAWLLLSAVAGRAQCLPAAACRPGSAPASAAAYGMGIFRVQLASLDTLTAGDDGYQDYSCRRAARLDRGTTYTLRVRTGTSAVETVRAWLDYNQDGTFDPTSEQILASTGQQHQGDFTVPTNLAPGVSLRLRIAADFVDSPLPGPCTTPHYSQTEDYRVVITSAALPRPQAAFTSLDSVTCSGTVHLRDQSRNTPTTWRWDFGDGTFSSLPSPQHTYASAGTYSVRLLVCNSIGCDSLRKTRYITVRSDGPRPITCQPATQAYCCDFGLTRVRLPGIDHRPGGGAAGYQDASCANRATLRADWPDTLRITTGGQGAHDVRVYLDVNDDGQFTPATELLYEGLGVMNPVVPLRLSSLTTGLVYNKPLRLRIWADYAGSPGTGPCASPQWGQVADYSILVLPNSLPPRAGFHLSYAQACGPVKVSVENTSAGSATYHWDFGDGTTSAAINPPTHTYAVPGLYTIKLLARSPVLADSVTQQTAVASCQSYCTSGGWGGNEDSPLYFTRVQVGDMDNTTFRTPRVGYRDFTSYVATARQGQRVPLRAESLPFHTGSLGPWVITTGWVDYNQDGQFGPSEQIGPYYGYSPHLGALQVPHQACLGATRLRLVIYLVNNGSGTFYNNGCLPANYLCATEDYTLLVLPEQTLPLTGFTADMANSCSGQVQFRDTTGANPTAWRWNFGDGTSSALANPLHTYTTAGHYTISLQATNAYGTVTATRPGYITVAAVGQGPQPLAVPLAASQLCCGYGIGQAQIASLAYQGSSDLPGYEDETCRLPALQLVAGQSYPLSVTRTNRWVNYQMYLWLDANNDGKFTADEKLFGSAAAYSGTDPKTGVFTVPATALRNQPLRLRLYWNAHRVDTGATPWLDPDPQVRDEEYDQVRDFTVLITGTTLASTAQQPLIRQTAYPVPANDWLTITGLQQQQTLYLFNSLGQSVIQAELKPDAAGECRVKIGNLPNGLYFGRLNASGSTLSVVVYHP